MDGRGSGGVRTNNCMNARASERAKKCREGEAEGDPRAAIFTRSGNTRGRNTADDFGRYRDDIRSGTTGRKIRNVPRAREATDERREGGSVFECLYGRAKQLRRTIRSRRARYLAESNTVVDVAIAYPRFSAFPSRDGNYLARTWIKEEDYTYTLSLSLSPPRDRLFSRSLKRRKILGLCCSAPGRRDISINSRRERRSGTSDRVRSRGIRFRPRAGRHGGKIIVRARARLYRRARTRRRAVSL